MIVPIYFEDLTTLHLGTEKPRAYYVPASHNMGVLVHDRESSDRFFSLNGIWDFRYFDSVYEITEKFYEPGADRSNFSELPVPSIWQNHGYDAHQYTNIRYPSLLTRPLCRCRTQPVPTCTISAIPPTPMHQKPT